MAFDLTKALGLGTDDIDKSVLGTPLMHIVQRGSPEFDESHKDHAKKRIEGVRAGDIIFGPTKSIIPRPMEVVVLDQMVCYVEWRPRNLGGGIVGHQPITVKDTNPNYRAGAKGSPQENKEFLGPNDLVYTNYFALLRKDGEVWKESIIAFQGGQLKYARLWAKAILAVKYPDHPDIIPPIFAAKWSLTTFPDNNAKGSYMSWQPENPVLLDLTTDQELLELAYTTHNRVAELMPSNRDQPPAALPAGRDVEVVDDEPSAF
jgi:hypothetical protein